MSTRSSKRVSPRQSARSVRRVRSHATLYAGALALTAFTAALSPSPLPAQDRSNTVEGATAAAVPRVRWIKYSILGALTGSALAAGYNAISSNGLDSGRCKPWDCALPFLSVSGALSGMFLAREIEAQRRALAPRVGGAERYDRASLALTAVPSAFALRDSLVAIVGDSGATVVPAHRIGAIDPKSLPRQGRGLARLRTIDLDPRSRRLLMGSPSALYGAAFAGGTIERLLAGNVTAVAVGPTPDSWAAARGAMITVMREGRRDSLTLTSSVNALSYDAVRRVWWAGSDSGLVAITDDGTTLRNARQYATPGPVRALTHGARWVVAALGELGAMGWREEPGMAVVSEPTVLRGSPRFVYDVAVAGDLLLLAAGSDGLVRLSLEPEWRVLGSAREYGYITGVRAAPDGAAIVTTLGERSVQRLVITP